MIQHVYPIEKGHITDDESNCWCNPIIEKKCNCDDPNCWRCGGTDWYNVESIDFDGDYIIIHEDIK